MIRCLKIRCLIVAALVAWGCAHAPKDTDTLFQVSTIDTLLSGIYEGVITCGELKEQGNFGIGTFEGVDGEMVVLDGTVYRISMDGSAGEVADAVTTPFAVVTAFDPDFSFRLTDIAGLKELEEAVDRRLPSGNFFYAVKVSGTVEYVKARSVPLQHPPYPPLVEVVKKQAVFEYSRQEGTMVGFRSPSYVKGVNVPGYHFHYLSGDRRFGGHVLDCRLGDVVVEIDLLTRFVMRLPTADAFYHVSLSEDKEKELHQVEK